MLRHDTSYAQSIAHAHICAYIYTSRHIFPLVRTHAQTCEHIHTWTYMHTCTHTCTHMYTYTHTHTSTLMRTHAHTSTHTCTHVYTHAHTHTHTHTHMYTHTRSCAHIYLHTRTRTGPNFGFAAFCGACSLRQYGVGAAFGGAVLAWIGIFLPGLLTITGILPLWHKFRGFPYVKVSFLYPVDCASMLVLSIFVFSAHVECKTLDMPKSVSSAAR